jgi:uncharacterized protein
MKTAFLLTISNIFMTFAWYGHLKHKDAALWKVVLVSWGIAFIEYWFAVPANRIGSNQGYSGAQLKVMQEVITLVVFAVFAIVYLKEKLQWNHLAAFALVAVAVLLVNLKPAAGKEELSREADPAPRPSTTRPQGPR